MSKNKPGKRRKRPELKNLLLLIILSLLGRTGRYRLKHMLNLSENEGKVRLMLDELKQEAYVNVRRTGCVLTEKGEKLLKTLLERYNIIAINEIDLKMLGLQDNCFAIQIRERTQETKLSKIIELRDVAVRAGADGAILIYNDNGDLKIPKVYDNLYLELPKIAKKLHDTFKLGKKDIIIVGFSKDGWRALEGALAIAKNIKNNFH